MRAFPVIMPSGVRYWTVLDEDLSVVAVADSFLAHVRFGRDGAESTTKSYAGSIALYLRWCAGTGRTWQVGLEQLGLFMTWLAHAGPGSPPDQRRVERGALDGGARGLDRAGAGSSGVVAL
ncbi:MAG: hypothetical protein ACYDDU_18955 [Dermatophilaceae bacterium]